MALRPGEYEGPVKLAVRTFSSEGLVKAFLAKVDESEMIEIARIDIGICDADRKTFDDWVQALSGYVARLVERKLGVTPRMDIRTPPDRERN